MFRVKQRGTARDGQHGVITEVYPNAVRFLSDTGAHFTLLNVEFFPSGSKQREVNTIFQSAKKFFKTIPQGEGFWFSTRKRRAKMWAPVAGGFIRSIPGYLGIPDGEPTT